ncbi:MAG: hypothetical protein HOD92_08350 [Deltaproteobacteria bacterium]|nr:hypothetical protein [Deltaproteobacteria bacterium]MBT4526383.1 hypothetical protein [Deltaproteobacteria bacterium]
MAWGDNHHVKGGWMKKILIVLLILQFPIISYAINFAPYLGPSGKTKVWYEDGKYITTKTLPGTITFNGVQVKVTQETIGGVVQSETYYSGNYNYGGKIFDLFIDGFGFIDASMKLAPPFLTRPDTFNIGTVFSSETTTVMTICDSKNSWDCENLYYSTNKTLTFLGFESVTVPIGTFKALKTKSIVTLSGTNFGITENETLTDIDYYVANIGLVKSIDLDNQKSSVLVSVNFPLPKEIDFDPEFYLKKYPDLAANGYSVVNVKDHWLTQGIYEGRQGSPYFDVTVYLQKNSDLKQAYGNDYYAAFTHWLNQGIYEGRQGSHYFDVKVYLQKNSDLKNVFANNYYAAFNHWVNNGIHEGRQGSPYLDVTVYLQKNSDLKQAYGSDYYAAFTHWLLWGNKEGRQGI